jgi:hypothetical protein
MTFEGAQSGRFWKVLPADAVASNARLVPYVKESLAVSTGLVPAAVVTVTSTVPVPAEGRRR